jgi:hypothetical protein
MNMLLFRPTITLRRRPGRELVSAISLLILMLLIVLLLTIASLIVVLAVARARLLAVTLSVLVMRRLVNMTAAWVEVTAAVIVVIRHGNSCSELLVLVFK